MLAAIKPVIYVNTYPSEDMYVINVTVNHTLVVEMTC